VETPLVKHSAPAPVPVVSPVQPVVPSNNNLPAQGVDSTAMMAMMKELIAAKNQPQPQIVITNTNTNTNMNDGMGQISYSLIMGFAVWFLFGWCFGGSCYLGRCSSLVLVIALILMIVSVGILGILFWILDFIFVLLTAIGRPPTDCHGRRAIYT
jgi:hypothetical protein